jgi:hypothetical protein
VRPPSSGGGTTRPPLEAISQAKQPLGLAPLALLPPAPLALEPRLAAVAENLADGRKAVLASIATTGAVAHGS